LEFQNGLTDSILQVVRTIAIMRKWKPFIEGPSSILLLFLWALEYVRKDVTEGTSTRVSQRLCAIPPILQSIPLLLLMVLECDPNSRLLLQLWPRALKTFEWDYP